MANARRPLIEWEDYFVNNGMLNAAVHIYVAHQNNPDEWFIGWPDDMVHNGEYERNEAYNRLKNMEIIENERYD